MSLQFSLPFPHGCNVVATAPVLTSSFKAGTTGKEQAGQPMFFPFYWGIQEASSIFLLVSCWLELCWASSYSHKGDGENVYLTLIASLMKGAGATGLGRIPGSASGDRQPRSSLVSSELCVLPILFPGLQTPPGSPPCWTYGSTYPAMPSHLFSVFPLFSCGQVCFSVSFLNNEVENFVLFCTHSSISFRSQSGICVLYYHDQ